MILSKPARTTTGARVRARRSAVQALYQWFLTERPMPEIINEFEHDRKELKKADGEYFREILSGISTNSGAIRDALVPFLDRPLKGIGPGHPGRAAPGHV